ncbi:IS1595 family transposase [Patescibacteria group bacterium]|nr:IS1595 family transposase [Patescibacteria group bacterium]
MKDSSEVLRRIGISSSKPEKSGQKQKSLVLGGVERKGRVAFQILHSMSIEETLPTIYAMIEKGTQIYSDSSTIFKNNLSQMGFSHDSVTHYKKKYVRGKVHTNTIEGFWNLVKRSFDGTYHVVSPKYLHSYLAEFAFRYNYRRASQVMFLTILN